jgi:hypothetical protein
MHGSRRRFAVLAASLLVLGATVSWADLIPGGGNAKSDCYAELKVLGAQNPGTTGDQVTKNKTLLCTDGAACDQGPAGDNQCTFSAALCINQTDVNVPQCTPPASLDSVKVKAKGAVKLNVQVPQLLTGSECGSFVDVTLTIPLKKNGKPKNIPQAKLSIVAKAPKGTKPRTDQDQIVLKCMPGGGTTTTTLPGCAANPNGGPDELDFVVKDSGTDLDNGWTGVSQNFPVDANSTLKLCLSGCDGTAATPMCTMQGTTGTNSLNGETFGAPLPLLASGVPVCVVNRYQPGNITGQVNFFTGDVPSASPLYVKLFSDTHFTSTTNVCPRCTVSGTPTVGAQGSCDQTAANPGKACTIQSILTVANGAGNKVYPLSQACPPTSGTSSGTLNIGLTLTTETSTLTGPKPCTQQPGTPAGVPVQDDNCHGTGCGTTCSGPLSCPTMNAQGQCLDIKGGIAQNCCNDNPGNPCFPTANGGSIVRTGMPAVPQPPPGDPTFPKTANGVLVTTYCEGATNTNTINQTTGLPGPGALILPTAQTWLKK